MKPKISAALVEAQKAVASVAKADQNQHFHYRYASSEDMMAAARTALHANGLALMVHRYAITPQPDATVVLEAVYRLVHASGEAVAIRSITPVVPERGRPPDKAIGAAKTYDLAYTLRGLLLIPRVEIGDEVDQRDDRGYDPDLRPSKSRRRARSAPETSEERGGAPIASGGISEDALRASLRALVAQAGGTERARGMVGPGDWPIGKKWSLEDAQHLHAALTEALLMEGKHGDGREADGSSHAEEGRGDV